MRVRSTKIFFGSETDNKNIQMEEIIKKLIENKN